MRKKSNKKDDLLPRSYLNLAYYLKKYLGKLPGPPLHPGTRKPLQPKDLEPIFPKELICQEMSLEKEIKIPDDVREIYKLYRPTPLIRAIRLEKFLKTPAHIYYKYEGASPVGSHKINTALPQAYFNKKEGVKKLTTETGAGQWGTALSLACRFFGLECLTYMVKISYEQKPYRKTMMRIFGGEVIPSPSETTQIGKKLRKDFPDTSGSLGMAISEAIEVAIKDQKTKYALGSVLNHVLLHQTIIGQEVLTELESLGAYPDVVIGCCGGGSNFAGIAFPFLAEKLKGRKSKIRFLGVEPENCASMSKGEYRYDHGDVGKQTPLLLMETLGCDYVPPAEHAGGLRYHGIAPLVAFLHQEKLIEAKSYGQKEIFQAGIDFACAEGIVPAPESAHAIKATIDEALRCKKQKKKENLVFCLSGHGMLDLKGYEDFLSGKMG